MRKLSLASLLLTITLSASVHTAELKESFSYGINYAWRNYSADFGGISAWGKGGVADEPEAFATELKDMAANGVEVVRWWVWPEFWTDSITFDANGAPQPLANSAINDALKALELADEAGIRVMLCLFSFDGFRETRHEFGISMTGYHDIVIDDRRRGALMTNVVQPLAAALSASPHLSALHSWDVINEPEWAITGANKYGGDNFEPNAELQPITHDQMEVFLGDTIKVLRGETPDIPITIGSAAVKWMSAWRETDIDFYQPHIYDWVNDYWPYSSSPTELGFGDKPMIMGEYPVEGLRDADHKTMLNSWLNNGYAGALGWDYRVTHAHSDDEVTRQRAIYLRELKEFAEANDLSGGNGSAGAGISGNTAEPSVGAAKELAPLTRPNTPTVRLNND